MKAENEIIDIVELKKKQWKDVKVKFLEKIHKRFKVRVEGLEDEKSKYFHPIIELDNDLIIKGQGDTESEYIYGLDIQVIDDTVYNNISFYPSVSINNDEHFEYIINNYEKVKQSLMESLKEVEKISCLKKDLETLQYDIIYNAVAKEVDKSKLKSSIEKIYSVTEYLENKRLNK